jgi:hypothetical protein
MKINMGTTDRIIRVILGIVALLIALFVTSGVWDGVLYVVSALLIITGIVGMCPAYLPFKISTNK